MFDALIEALEREGLNPLPIAVTSLKDATSREVIARLVASERVALVLNTTAFAAGAIDAPSAVELAGDAPVLQVILSGGNREAWLADPQGLHARDIAMHVALPEVDGRIVTRAVSFKGLAYRCPHTEVDVVRYQPDAERIAFVAELSRRWCRLRTEPNAGKRLALVLANYPTSEGRIGNGVGLDTPASALGILAALGEAGYTLAGPLPETGDALIARLTEGVTNDPTSQAIRPAFQSLAMDDYRRRYARLPAAAREAIEARWGEPEQDPTLRHGRFPIAGWRAGQVFVGIQPARTREANDYASYHDAEIVPPHAYLAFYFWLRDAFAIDAIVHVGKHGNLEWLPGKSVALSEACWPDLILGPLPHLYPFIVNDPGEGSQAKRRAQAVIVDHLMPPLTRAENYGPLQDLERQVDEYYDALMVDPRRAKLLRRSILDTIVEHRLHEELSLAEPSGRDDEDALLTRVDAWLCELKEAQIRDGLHVFGRSPEARQRRDTLLALARFPVGDGLGANAGLIAALARDLQLGAGFDPLAADWAAPWQGPRPAELNEVDTTPWRHAGDTRERLELLAQRLVAGLAGEGGKGEGEDGSEGRPCSRRLGPPARARRRGRRARAASPARRSRALAGHAGRARTRRARSRAAPGRLRRRRVAPSAARPRRPFRAARAERLALARPSRRAADRPQLLLGRHARRADPGSLVARHEVGAPTGRAASAGAWRLSARGRPVGMGHGHHAHRRRRHRPGLRADRRAPEVGARQPPRVTDFEILPIEIFDRPRIDVTLRVSGFFRDAFANLMHLFDAAVQAVAELDEPAHLNPIRERVRRDAAALVERGASAEEARRRAGWRVFGARPGSYGAGLQELIDQRNWQSDADLARAYQSWGGYAYAQGSAGEAAQDAFGARLANIDAVVQNQDNREHDLLDSNDYYQFQGGMAVAVRHLSGRQPALYHGDHSRPDTPRMNTLGEEIARVIRSRVVNPKWIDGVKRHGYKGAAELAATVDYLYGYDATARVVADHQYALVTDAYVNDADTRDFLERHNPHALHGICERLLEAIQRGLWQQPGAYREQLEARLLAVEQHLEGTRR